MYNVLIVEDMDIARLELRRLKLWGEKSGFIITAEARNGEEALQKFENNRIDMVITDIRMPKINGIELLSHIVEKSLCSCVVLLSDFTEFSYAKQGIVLGAFDYISKPVNEEELAKLLQRAGQFIENEHKEKARIRKLEETAGEKIETAFPSEEVSRLIELIEAGSAPMVEAARMVDVVGSSFNHDPIKVQSILQNGISRISDGLIDRNSWLQKFINAGEYKNLSFYNLNEFHEMKNRFLQSVQKLASLFRTLRCGIHDSGVAGDVCRYILNNVDTELSLGIVADKLYMNKNYVSEAFKQKTGMSFVEYLTLVKMERAKILISVDGLKTYQAAETLSFNDTEYFSRIFKKHAGMSPTDYRQVYKSDNKT